MKILKPILFLLLVLFLSFCNDNPITDEKLSGDFLFEVNLIDANNNALAGYTVSVWNDYFSTSSLMKNKEQKNMEAATQVEFMLPTQSIVDLNIFKLDGELYETLVKSELLNAGQYRIQFYHPNNVGTDVLKIVLNAKEDSQSSPMIYSDSIYAVMIAPDPEVAKIGFTDNAGKFSITNKLLFPHLYDLPEFIRTDASGPQELGKFNLENKYVICLTNTQTNDSQYFSKEISEGENIFTLVWGFGESVKKNSKESYFMNNNLYQIKNDSIILPTSFKLFQNYPNPFN